MCQKGIKSEGSTHYSRPPAPTLVSCSCYQNIRILLMKSEPKCNNLWRFRRCKGKRTKRQLEAMWLRDGFFKVKIKSGTNSIGSEDLEFRLGLSAGDVTQGSYFWAIFLICARCHLMLSANYSPAAAVGNQKFGHLDEIYQMIRNIAEKNFLLESRMEKGGLRFMKELSPKIAHLIIYV